MRTRHLTATVVITLLVGLFAAGPARAGYYTVSGTCGHWAGWGGQVAIFPACPDLVARNIGQPWLTPYGAYGGWRFDPPPGTAIATAGLRGSLVGGNGWQAWVASEGISAREMVACPSVSCPQGSTGLTDYPAFNSGALVVGVRCVAPGGCSGAGLYSQAVLNSSTITLSDGSAPSLSVAGGSLVSGGWKSGKQTLTVNAADNIGIREVRALVDGVRVSSVVRACDFSQKVPCSNGQTTLELGLGGLADGAHTIGVEAIDASGNLNTIAAAGTFYVDNTAPAEPLEPQVRGGAGWRAQDEVSVSWRNPPQNAAPVAGVGYRLCPQPAADADATTTAAAQARCRSGARWGNSLTEIKDLELPGPGLWRLQLWLIDAAGNQHSATAVELYGLGYDDAPPEAIAFQAPDPQDPARVRFAASDPVSGLAAGVIEIRREDQSAWQPLDTRVDASGLSALMDDETLPKGLYFLRARVRDAAGLEASNDRAGDGLPATTKLPVRLASRLQAGRRGSKRCTGRGRHRRCHNRLVARPTVRVGRQTRLYGRLTVAGQPMPNAPVQVWRQLDLTGTGAWEQIATVTTSRTGRFSYLAPRGPARTIRFRYPGSGQIRGRNGDVALRVRAASTIRAGRRTVINGEYVTFRGRLTGGWIPAAGALVELQVRTRGQWRTFAQPRASAQTGRWSYRYRFQTVQGGARFTFRARIRRQPGLPFTTGHTRTVHVRVRGL
ncbi:hypothetical protein DVA67_011950 [Solirubrobacter sp. CPCC 204708]|uniref:Carboxypeptidase regulatory-like domain-containing protein n=1 Tax=Solirubrobacter deserti TaxID=2282478 RepID=A0ABT4RLL9_9ACTN|nr:hypothetical protein [Solirubrobacter deserti]MBE2316690.1 hypothetical protein [Solirubrobacter deserti]MDA0139447.1 hypothetical protein [Solirubrobacter deserti]